MVTVLVPLDGSDDDERALPIAADLAGVADAALHVIRVVDASTASAPHENRSHAERGVREAAERLAPHLIRPVTWEVLDGGDVAGVLLGRATALNAAAVVMATRAARAVSRAVHGSVADRVMREGGRLVVLVPPRADYLRGRQVRLRRGLIPLDGSDAAIAALAHLLAFPHAEELDLVLLEVVLPDLRRAASGDAERRLDALAAQVRGRRATAETRVVEARDPTRAIIDAIRQDLVDFVAMSTRGAGGIERMVLGSVATSVVRASEVPVLLVPPNTILP
jgi:nucleotide-binding universal stress UspA family protein